MANAWCLTKELSTEFKARLKSGEIDPEKLALMDSATRHNYFSSFLGEDNALKVNSLFESNLLLKNQQSAMINWAKKVGGISEPVKRDLITKIEKMDTILNPEKDEPFLQDLASTKLGGRVTVEQAQKITELSSKVSEARTAIDKNFNFPTNEARLDYGRSVVDLTNYVNDLKNGKPTTIVEKISNIAGSTKAIRASMDDSAIFRQGWRVIWTHPGIWSKNAAKSFADLFRTFGKDEVMGELNADLISRPNYLNGNYKTMKLALGNLEEDFPSTFPEKLPVVGKMYKASENAFTAFIQKTRADVADKYLEIAQKSGVQLDEPNQLESIGKLVNSLIGRGNLGRAEPAANVVNNVFFSPRKLKADLDVLTLHASDKNFSTFARKQAGYNLLKVVMGSAAILGIARAVNSDSVETDPRSADFGKIKAGDTRFDVTGGVSSIITLAARLLTGASKSSTSGNITSVSNKFGGTTRLDYVTNFIENKLSPVASVVKDLLKGQDFQGNTPTLAGEAANLFVPLPITNAIEVLKDPNSANKLITIIADALGIATNTYAPAVKSQFKGPGSKTSDVNVLNKVNSLLSSLTTPVQASDGKEIASIAVKGDNVITTYKDGTIATHGVNSDLTLSQQIGKVIYDIGKSAGWQQSDLSKQLGYIPPEEQKAAIQRFSDTVQKQGGTERKQLGWKDSPDGDGYLPVFSDDPNPKPQYRLLPGAKPIPKVTATNGKSDTGAPPNPYKSLVTKHFPDPGVANQMSNTMFGESSYDARNVHFNDTGASMHIPDNFTQTQWNQIEAQHPSDKAIDVGLLQIDKTPVMTHYLNSKGMTYFDLLDPEKNLQIASDLYYGKIPYMASGITNWNAAKGLGYWPK